MKQVFPASLGASVRLGHHRSPQSPLGLQLQGRLLMGPPLGLPAPLGWDRDGHLNGRVHWLSFHFREGEDSGL